MEDEANRMREEAEKEKTKKEEARLESIKSWNSKIRALGTWDKEFEVKKRRLTGCFGHIKDEDKRNSLTAVLREIAEGYETQSKTFQHLKEIEEGWKCEIAEEELSSLEDWTELTLRIGNRFNEVFKRVNEVMKEEEATPEPEEKEE